MAFAKNKNGRGNSKHQIYESVKKGLDTLLKSFRDDESCKGIIWKFIISDVFMNVNFISYLEYTFSASLSTEERAYIHASAQAMGMKSRSQGYLKFKIIRYFLVCNKVLMKL